MENADLLKIKKSPVWIFISDKFPAILESGYFAYGLLLAGWSPVFVMFGYWMEEFVNYFFSLAKMIKVRRERKAPAGMVFYFIFIYGFFWFVHTVFFLVICGFFAKRDIAAKNIIDYFLDSLILGGRANFTKDFIPSTLILLAVVILYSSLKYYFGFIRKKRHLEWNLTQTMNSSFGPIIAPHLIIIFGLGAIIAFNLHSAFAIIIVIVKFLMDWFDFGNKPNPGDENSSDDIKYYKHSPD